MVTGAEVAGTVSTLKALWEVIRDARNSNDPRKLKEAIDVAYERLLSAREIVAALQDERTTANQRVAALEAELVAKVRFDELAPNFELHRYFRDAYAYLKKGTPKGATNVPRYCQPCFDNRKLSLLHATGQHHERQHYYACPACRAQFLMGSESAGAVG